MSKFRDISGLRFGKLVVAERIFIDSTKKPMWRSVCDCGGESISTASDLVAGKVNSCGCARKETISKKTFVDISGKKFGRLTAKTFFGVDKNKKRIWICECECGNVKNVKYSSLVNGSSKSCGCLSIDRLIERSTKHGMCKLGQKERKKIDNVFAFSSRIRVLIGNCFANSGFKKGSKTEEILGCTFAEFMLHIERQFSKGMNWKNREKWHIDHIVPISQAKTIDEVIRLNHHTNLMPLWAKDNLKKSSKSIYLI